MWMKQITRMWMHCFKHAGRTLRSSSAHVTASMLYEQTCHLAAENMLLRQSCEGWKSPWQQAPPAEGTRAEAAACYEVQIFTGKVQVSPVHDKIASSHGNMQILG
jgi:hypothetical protein